MRIGDGQIREIPLSTGTSGAPRAGGSNATLRPSEGPTTEREKAAGPSPFARMLRGIGREIDRGEHVVKDATHGEKDLSPSELLALQAGVYRYSEAIDLSSKLIDRATSGVKTVISNQ